MNKSVAAFCAISVFSAMTSVALADSNVKTAAAQDSKKVVAEANARHQLISRYTQAIIDRMDADQNGEITRAQFMDFMSREFAALDQNGDGKLQKSEIMNRDMMSGQSTLSQR